MARATGMARTMNQARDVRARGSIGSGARAVAPPRGRARKPPWRQFRLFERLDELVDPRYSWQSDEPVALMLEEHRPPRSTSDAIVETRAGFLEAAVSLISLAAFPTPPIALLGMATAAFGIGLRTAPPKTA